MAYEEGFQEFNGDDFYLKPGFSESTGLPEDGRSGHSGDQRIQHVFKVRGCSIDVLYPLAGMDSIWLSDSPNGV